MLGKQMVWGIKFPNSDTDLLGAGMVRVFATSDFPP